MHRLTTDDALPPRCNLLARLANDLARGIATSPRARRFVAGRCPCEWCKGKRVKG